MSKNADNYFLYKRYPIRNLNEPNPEIQAVAEAELYMSLIRKSENPERMFDLVIKALEKESEQEKAVAT